MTLLVLFGWCFAAATILPLSSEVALALAVRQTGDWRVPVLVGTLGNVLGACTTYWLARLAVTKAPPPGPRMRSVSGWLARFGSPALLLSWVPLAGDLLVALAGAAGMPFARFVLWTTVGKAARYLAVGWAVRQF